MSIVVSLPNDAHALVLGGARFDIRVRGADTGESLSVVDVTAAPGFVGPPALHHHVDLDWSGRVLQGTLRIEDPSGAWEVAAGGVFAVPRGTDFRWGNVSATDPLVFTCTYAGRGFDRYFTELAAAVAALGRPPAPQELGPIIGRLWAAHGIAVHAP